MIRKPKLGDVFVIPLSNNKLAYGQYIFQSKYGPIIRIFDLVTKNEFPPLEEILLSKLMFPPVITGLYATIRSGEWKIIGHEKTENLAHPRFVSTLYDEKTGKAGAWYLWDGEKDVRLGFSLSREYQSLEFLIVWNPKNIAERIETKKAPFPYTDLIRHNKFHPEG